MTYKEGDNVYYSDTKGNTIPATVSSMTMFRVKIEGNFPEGDRIVWVTPGKLTPQ